MKFSILSFLLLALLSIDLCRGQSKVMKEYHRSFSGKRITRDVFIKRFPYDNYLNSVEFTDFKTLQSDREYVYRNFGEGDIFLYSLGDYFIKHYPVGIDDLEKKIDIGELYLSDKRRSHGFNRSKNEIYTIMGYFILGRAAQTLEEQISSGKVNEKNSQIRQIIQRLKNNKIFVSMETSTLDKLVQNLQKGNVAYVWDRILLKVQAYVGHIPAYIILGLLMLVAYFFIFKKTRYFSLWLLGGAFLLGLTCFLVKKYSRGNGPVIASSSQATPLRPPKYYLDNKYFYHKEGGKHRMMVFGIENEEGREIGQSIWLGRPRMKANYFAYQNVPQKFHQHSRRRQVVMAATAGFTNSEGQPEGLTVEAGNIVNAVIMHDRHGLVIVESFGGLRVINLKRKSIRLPVSRKQSLTIANPLHSLVAYSTLLNWCRQRRATLFQTQLLAYGDQLLIDPSKSPIQERERRLLVAFRDRESKDVYHAIFNIQQPHNLAMIAEETFMMVGNRGMKIEFILNLDVGSYDILNVFNPAGRLLTDVKGPVSLNQATNLIVWNK